MNSRISLRHLAALASLTWVFLLTSCVLPKVYVDPQYHVAKLEDLAPSTPKPVKLTVTGLTNRKLNARASKLWTTEVTSVLGKTHVFAVSTAADAGTLEIEINNIGDTDEAMKKGFVTGLTLGLAGTAVTDRYIMTATYRDSAGGSFSGEYKHALHTVIGREDAPIQGVAPTPLKEAPGKLVEDMLLNFLRDFQLKATPPPASAR